MIKKKSLITNLRGEKPKQLIELKSKEKGKSLYNSSCYFFILYIISIKLVLPIFMVEGCFRKELNIYKSIEKGKEEDELLDAAAKGNVEKVSEILKSRNSKIINIDCKDINGATPLFKASHEGYKEIVELLIKSGANIDQANKDGRTPLYMSSQRGHKEVVELLIKSGANIDQADRNGQTPIYIASYMGHKELVGLLIKRGAKIDQTYKGGETLLFLASKRGDKELVELLIKRGANINQQVSDESTPLYIASASGNKEVVELLIKRGANINQQVSDECTPLYAASAKGNKEVVELLIKAGAKIDLAISGGFTPLFIASNKGYKEIVELLIKNGANINQADDDGRTSLLIAGQTGEKEIVELLIKAGAKIDQAMSDGRTPLYVASQLGRKEVVELLIKRGANIDQAMSEGRTPLYVASQEGHKEVVELLIKRGANIDQAMSEGRTPLYVASQEGHKEVAELLIKNKAEIDQVDNEGATALWVASERGKKEIVELLIRSGAESDKAINSGRTPLYIASANGHIEIVELLIKKGVNINHAISDGRTPLYPAIYYEYKNVVELLINKGADLNIKTTDDCIMPDDAKILKGSTPLDVAIQRGNKEIETLLKNALSLKRQIIRIEEKNEGFLKAVEDANTIEIMKLLREGIDINIKNKDGKAPLHIASQNGNKVIVELLIKSGANIDQVNNNGSTPIYIASGRGYKEVVELLIKNGARIDQAKGDGSAPLHIASYNGYKEVVELLIKSGAKVDQAMNDGVTSLYIASQNGHKEVAELLIKSGAKIDQTKDGEFTPLLIATQKGHKEVVELLIKKGANLNIKTTKDIIIDKNKIPKGSTPLDIAAQVGNKEIETLLKNVLSLNKTTTQNKSQDSLTTLFHIAAKDGDIEGLRFLLEHNIQKIDEVNEEGQTALHIAIKNNHNEISRLLIEKGCNINIKDNNGDAPDSMALRSKNYDILKVLIDLQTNKSEIENKKINSPASIVKKDYRIELFEGINEGNIIKVKEAIGEIKDIEDRIAGEWTSLMLAATKDNDNIVRLLLEAGAKVDAEDKDGWDAALLSVGYSRINNLKLIIKYGYNPNKKSKKGLSVIEYAKLLGNNEIVSVLEKEEQEIKLIIEKTVRELGHIHKLEIDNLMKKLESVRELQGLNIDTMGCIGTIVGELNRKVNIQSKDINLLYDFNKISIKEAEEINREKEIIDASKELKEFYEVIRRKINQAMIAAQVIESGAVQSSKSGVKQETWQDKLKGKVVSTIKGVAEDIPVPGVGLLVNVLDNLRIFKEDREKGKAIKNMNSICIDIREAEVLSEKIARKITIMKRGEIKEALKDKPKGKIRSLIEDAKKYLANKCDLMDIKGAVEELGLGYGIQVIEYMCAGKIKDRRKALDDVINFIAGGNYNITFDYRETDEEKEDREKREKEIDEKINQFKNKANVIGEIMKYQLSKK